MFAPEAGCVRHAADAAAGTSRTRGRKSTRGIAPITVRLHGAAAWRTRRGEHNRRPVLAAQSRAPTVLRADAVPELSRGCARLRTQGRRAAQMERGRSDSPRWLPSTRSSRCLESGRRFVPRDGCRAEPATGQRGGEGRERRPRSRPRRPLARATTTELRNVSRPAIGPAVRPPSDSAGTSPSPRRTHAAAP